MHDFCAGFDSNLKPKAVGHITLARTRFDSEVQRINNLYTTRLNSLLRDPSAHSKWDVVFLELVSGERTKTRTSPLTFKEIHRVPLASL